MLKASIIAIVAVVLVISSVTPTFAITYRPKSELINRFISLCNQHSEASYEVIGKSYQGRSICIFKIGNPNAPAVMWDGSMHGWEDLGSETMYHLTKWLLESNDPEANRILQRNYVLFIPIVNMDSSERQNKNYEYSRYGVDLNRNFKYGWRYSSSKSDYPNTYHGDYAASEPETQAVRAAMAKFRPVFYVNTHTGGSYLSYDQNGNMNKVNAFLSLYSQLARDFGVSKYSVSGGRAGNGLAHGDAKEFGGTGFLFEMASSSGAYRHTSPTLSQIENYYFPKCKPILIAMCQASEGKEVSTSVSTTTSSSETTQSESNTYSSGQSSSTTSTSTSSSEDRQADDDQDSYSRYRYYRYRTYYRYRRSRYNYYRWRR